MSGAFYNEHDPKAAAWLRELIAEGHIAPGVVDDRDVQNLKGDELAGFTQVHLFAGIGGWSYALRLAGWADDRAVWTGSCPCQPFSSAGRRRGSSDERHMWPVMRGLVEERRPATIFGEQVASRLGRQWLAGVRADLEAMEYALGAADLCAACVGAPDIRQRLYWMADAGSLAAGLDSRSGVAHGAAAEIQAPRRGEADAEPSGRGAAGRLADADGAARQRADGDGSDARADRRYDAGGGRKAGRLGNAAGHGRPRDERRPRAREEPGHACASVAGAWSAFDVIPCRDGKARRVEPGTFPLAHGVPGRVGLLRGYGNAIVPQVAAAFILAAAAAESGVAHA